MVGSLVWLKTTYGGVPVATPADEDPFDRQFGIHSVRSHFWSVRIEDLTVSVEPSTWVNRVLPAFGFEHARLVEVAFPPPLPQVGHAAESFADALRAYDRGEHRSAIDKCRTVFHAWEQQLGASKAAPVAAAIAKTRGWPVADPRRIFVDELWKTLKTYVDAGHHVADQAQPPNADAADARLCLMTIAVLSEHLHSSGAA
jgi:hypothetical protein